MDDSEITCDDVIESKDEETNFNEKKEPVKREFLYFACICINYYRIIDSCQYLVLSDKISRKPKHFLPFQLTNNKLKEIIYLLQIKNQ